MSVNTETKDLLKQLPGVDRLLEAMKNDADFADVPRSVQLSAARETIAALRKEILGQNGRLEADGLSSPALLQRLKSRAQAAMSPNLLPLVNATGVIVHTNLGRSLLAASALVIVACGLFYASPYAVVSLRAEMIDAGRLEFMDGFYFSTITFTTLGFGDMYPASSDLLTRCVAMFESLSGACLMALFVVSLSKRYSRG